MKISDAEVRGWRQTAEGRNVHLLTKTIIAAQNITGVVLVLNIVPDKAQKISGLPRTRYAATGSAVLTTFRHRGHPLFVQPIALFPAAQILGIVGPHPSIALARTLERSKPLPRNHEGMAFAADTWHQTASEQYVKTTNVAAFSHIAALDPIFAPTAPVLPG